MSQGGSGHEAAAYPMAQTPMPDPPNATIAALFDELGDLYELDGAIVHRVLAYRNAAKAVREAPRSVAAHDARGHGHRAARHRHDARGEDPRAARDRRRSRPPRSCAAKFPPGLIDITRLPGPRAQARAPALRRARHRLARGAARGGRGRSSCATCAGFGPKFEEAVLAAFAAGRRRGAARRACCCSKALQIGEAIVEALRAHPAVATASSWPARRAAWPTASRTSTSSPPPTDPPALLARLRRARRRSRARLAPGENAARGAHAHRHGGRPARRRARPVRQPAPALHRLARRTTWRCARRAVRRGLHVSRVRDARRRHRRDAPLRDRGGGLRAARPAVDPARAARGPRRARRRRRRRCPALIEQGDLRGDLHCTRSPRDGRNTIEEMARGRARARPTSTSRSPTTRPPTASATTSRPTQLRAPDRAVRALERARSTASSVLDRHRGQHPARRLARLRRRAARASSTGSIGSVHTSFAMAPSEMTERMVAAIEHPLDRRDRPPRPGARSRRAPPYAIDVDARDRGGRAHRHDARDQLRARPPRPQRRPRARRRARRACGSSSTPTPTASTRSGITRWGVATARRAWLTQADVANTLPWARVRAAAQARALRASASAEQRAAAARRRRRGRPRRGGRARAPPARARRSRAPGRRARRAAPAPGRRRRAAGRARGRAAARRRARAPAS